MTKQKPREAFGCVLLFLAYDFLWVGLAAALLLSGEDNQAFIAIGTSCVVGASYFTALLDARPDNPLQPRRQLVYLRALATLPGLEIHYGKFRSGTKRRPLAEPAPGLPASMLFRASEEKGSDVNLATRLLVDGFNGDYEQAVVVSNDADFAAAMRYVRDGLARRVTLVNPDPINTSPRDLSDTATYVKRLWKSHLRRSRFTDTLTDQVGLITKPSGW